DGKCAPLTGKSCDDHDKCTQTDTCNAGACVGSNPVTCPAEDQCHDAGTCDKSTGQCNNAKANGTACSDNNACTANDTCKSGICQPGEMKPCTAMDLCHLPGTCAPETGECDNPLKPEPPDCASQDECKEDCECDPSTGWQQRKPKPWGSYCEGGQCINGKCS